MSRDDDTLARAHPKNPNLMAAFISLSKDNEQPMPSLMEAVEESARN